jgi:hypothetical protein
MNSDGRSRRRELVEEAYNLQVKAGLMASRIPLVAYHHFPDLSHSTPSLYMCVRSPRSQNRRDFTSLSLFPSQLIHIHIKPHRQRAAQYGAFGLGSAIFAHRTWPTFQSVSAPPLGATKWPPLFFSPSAVNDLLYVLARRQTLAFKGFLVSISRPPRAVSSLLSR